MSLIARITSAICALTLGACPAWAAPSFLVVDVDTNQTVLESGSEHPRSIASITKLMTAVTVLESGDNLNDEVLVTKQDYVSSTAIVAGRRYTRRELMLLALVKSDNGAAHALARSHNAGYESFIVEMNHRARYEIGMTHSSFVDSSGLHAENKSTTHDLVKLLIYSQRYQFIREASDQKTVSVGRRIYNSTNHMLRAGWDIVVAKTGFTNAAGQCFIAVWEERGHKFAMVILGSNHRWVDSQQLKTKVLSIIGQ